MSHSLDFFCRTFRLSHVRISVRDPWHFGAEPDPCILISESRIQILIHLLSSVTLRIQKKLLFQIFSYNLPAGSVSSALKIYFSLKFFVKIFYFVSITSVRQPLLWEEGRIRNRIRIRTSLTNGSRSRKPKNIRIRILNTGQNNCSHRTTAVLKRTLM